MSSAQVGGRHPRPAQEWRFLPAPAALDTQRRHPGTQSARRSAQPATFTPPSLQISSAFAYSGTSCVPVSQVWWRSGCRPESRRRAGCPRRRRGLTPGPLSLKGKYNSRPHCRIRQPGPSGGPSVVRWPRFVMIRGPRFLLMQGRYNAGARVPRHCRGRLP